MRWTAGHGFTTTLTTAARRVLVVSLALVLSLVLAGCRSTGTAEKSAALPAAPKLTAAQVQENVESFDIVWTTIRDKHFDPKFNGVDWEAVRVELRPKVESATTMAQARAVMQEMLARLGQTHFAIIPASVYDDADEGADEKHDYTAEAHKDHDRGHDKGHGAPTHAPATSPASDEKGGHRTRKGDGSAGFDVRVIGAKAIVTRVEPEGAAARAGVKSGWELVSVRGRAVAPIIETVGSSVKSDSLRPGMQSIMIGSLFDGSVGIAVGASFLDEHDARRDVSLVLQSPRGTKSTFGNMPAMVVDFECARLKPNIAYFRLSMFFDPPGVMKAFRKCVMDARAGESKPAADGFIIDLRGNPGGIGFMASGMANLFVDQRDLKLGELIGRGGPLFKFVLEPQPLRFDGPLAVLIDENSMSTSEILAGGLQDIGRARVFGVRSAGAALPSTVERLPNGDGFQYAVANYITTGGKVLEGVGVLPDEVVVPDRAALLAGEDPILDAAARWIVSQQRVVK